MTDMTNSAIGQLKDALHRILDAIRVNEVELAKSAAPTKIQAHFVLEGTLSEQKIAEDERKTWKARSSRAIFAARFAKNRQAHRSERIS